MKEFSLGEGTTRFLMGAAVGAVGGFAVGAFAATPAARFLGRTTVHAIDALGGALESGYTRIRGREKYLEHEIEELREQITRLEQRID